MNINNRRFVYPVLSEDKDDYKESVFEVDFDYSMEGVNRLKLSFDFKMTCQAIEQLILNGDAEYTVHLECSTTAYREVISNISRHINHIIPIERVNGTLQIVAFVILKKPITNFKCEDWVDDYEGLSFNLVPGTIIAYQNLPNIDITKDFEEFANAGSIFSIYRRLTDDERPAEINMEASQIRIGLSSKDYDVYSSFSSRSELQPVFHSMLVLPALIYVFEELKQEGNEEVYKHREWYMALESAYKKRGVSFREEVLESEKSSYQLAQEAMELPLSKAFDQINSLINSFEEDS